MGTKVPIRRRIPWKRNQNKSCEKKSWRQCRDNQDWTPKKKEESVKENATKTNLIAVAIADGTELYDPSGLLHLPSLIDMGTSISTQI